MADFALQTLLKVTVDFLPNARAGHLIKSSIFVTKRLVGAIWCLNATVLFTFAKPYLNFVYHGICRICPIILVLRGSSCFFVAVFLVACFVL